MFKRTTNGLFSAALSQVSNAFRGSNAVLEQQVIDHIKSFLQHQAQLLQVPVSLIRVRIRRVDTSSYANVYSSAQRISILDMAGIARFIAGPLAVNEAVEQRVEAHLAKYFDALASEHQCAVESLAVQFSKRDEVPSVQLFVDGKYVTDLSIKALINEFQ